MKGTGGYPMFESLVEKMKSAVASAGSVVDSPRSDPG
jgi:hypothetical protein